MAAPSSDLAPAYLREAWNRAIGDPTSDNAPLQRFAAPIDGVTMADTVVASTASLPSKYGVARYAAACYGN